LFTKQGHKPPIKPKKKIKKSPSWPLAQKGTQKNKKLKLREKRGMKAYLTEVLPYG